MGIIYCSDIKRGLKILSFHDFNHIIDEDLNLVMAAYDLDKDGGMKFSEFSSMIESKIN